jgi:hypothetical protein
MIVESLSTTYFRCACGATGGAGLPNRARRSVLRKAARAAWIADPEVRVVVVDTEQEAQLRGFVGSPTFLVEGVGLVRSGRSSNRITGRPYATASGPSGVP